MSDNVLRLCGSQQKFRDLQSATLTGGAKCHVDVEDLHQVLCKHRTIQRTRSEKAFRLAHLFTKRNVQSHFQNSVVCVSNAIVVNNDGATTTLQSLRCPEP